MLSRQDLIASLTVRFDQSWPRTRHARRSFDHVAMVSKLAPFSSCIAVISSKMSRSAGSSPNRQRVVTIVVNLSLVIGLRLHILQPPLVTPLLLDDSLAPPQLPIERLHVRLGHRLGVTVHLEEAL